MATVQTSLDLNSVPTITLKSPIESTQHISNSILDPTLTAALRRSLKRSEVLTAESDRYEEKIKRWASSSEKPAGAIVLATSAVDVSTAVVFARDNFIDLAVRGGGHSTSGASSTDGGLVIDLSLMRRVFVDPTTRTIAAQGGCMWADVDEAAGLHGLAAVGGTVNHTGIGGLTLGGGYGWLSGLHGLTIDNLLSVEVVLADGSIITASSTSNPELFWAIRGAGHAFGVVTSFTFRGHEQRKSVYAGLLAFHSTRLPSVVAFANNLIATSNGEKGMTMVFASPPPHFAPCVMVAVFSTLPEAAALRAYAPLLALEPLMNTATMVPYASVNGMLNNAAMPGGRRSIKGASYTAPLRPAFVQSVFDDYVYFVTSTPDANQTIVIFEFIADGKICSVPHDAMAFANRGHHQNVMCGPKWNDKANDAVCRDWARKMAGNFQEEMKGQKEEGVGMYVNYDGLGEEGEVIYGSNYQRVRELKRKYDPGNLFGKTCVKV